MICKIEYQYSIITILFLRSSRDMTTKSQNEANNNRKHNFLQDSIYRILPKTRASPNRRAHPPPPKNLDHVPEVSIPKIYMTMQFNDRFNAVLTIC